eukprot:3639091-Rhodomonas_salina.3
MRDGAGVLRKERSLNRTFRLEQCCVRSHRHRTEQTESFGVLSVSILRTRNLPDQVRNLPEAGLEQSIMMI